MAASLLQADPLEEQVRTFLSTVDCLQAEVRQLRSENTELREEVCKLRCDSGYWQSRYAAAQKRDELVQSELSNAKGEIRLLKEERFGQSSEKQWEPEGCSEVDNSDPLVSRNKRGQQSGRPAPNRRDDSHLAARTQLVDLPKKAKVCDDCREPFEGHGGGDDGEQIEIERLYIGASFVESVIAAHVSASVLGQQLRLSRPSCFPRADLARAFGAAFLWRR